MNYICNSGGAMGADLLFEKECLKKEIKVNAFSFEGHGTASKCKVILNNDQLKAADDVVKSASLRLNRPIPKNQYIKNLLRRNWYQVKNADTVYAVGKILPNKNVDGGTGWAIALTVYKNSVGIDNKTKIFVYDQIQGFWVWWNGNEWRYVE